MKNFRTPFDISNPVGYLFSFLIQVAGAFFVCNLAVCSVGFFIGVSAIFVSFAKDMKQEQLQFFINETNKNTETKRNLSKFIDLHSNAKQLSKEEPYYFQKMNYNDLFTQNVMIDFSVIRWRFSNTSFWIIFFGVFQRYAVHFSWFSSNLLSTIFSLLYLLHFFNYIRVEYLAWLSIQKHAGISLMLVNQLCVTFWSFALIFLFCNFGEKISGQFTKLNDVIYQCNWYLCPLKIQQMFPMILTATQNVPTMTSFGNVVCSRESFKKVTFIVPSKIHRIYRIYIFMLTSLFKFSIELTHFAGD